MSGTLPRLVESSFDSFPLTLFGAIDKMDWFRLRELLAPEVIYERPGYKPLIGLDQVMHFYRETRNVSIGSHIVERVAGDGSNLACHGRFNGMSKEPAPLVVEFCDFYVFSAGLLKYRKTFFYVPAV